MDVARCLSGSLSPDTNTRIAAELRLAELFVQPETGLALSQLIGVQDVELSLRQSASIVLRKYIQERWSPYFASFKGSAPPPEIKSQIRDAVFSALSDPNRKIRTLCAHTLSSIANSDWPDEYPNLLSSLITLLSSGSSDSVHGAMQLFTEFIKSDLTEDQILPVMRQLLPVLLSILGAKDQHTPLTRARTVSVFRQCVSALYMVKEHFSEPVKEATSSVLPMWLDAFNVLLSIDPASDISQNWENLAIRIQIFKALDNIHTSFPRAMTPHLKSFMALSLQHLHALYPAFQKYYLSSSEPIPFTSEDERIELSHLICPIFDFITVVARSGKAKDWFAGESHLNLTSVIFEYSQMTDDDEETWANNANAFIAQEDDDSQSYSVRIAGFDLLTVLLERAPATLSASFHTIIQKVVLTSTENRSKGQPHWWRPLEASLAAIGSQADVILECIEDEQDSGRASPIDIESLLSSVVPSVLNLAECPFLQGRGFVFASQYAKLLPAGMTGQYLEAAIQVVENAQASIPVKVSAVKAIHNFSQGSADASIVPFAPRIAKDLGPFLLATSEDTLTLVLESLSVVLEVEKGSWLDADLADSLVVAVLEVWQNNRKDPIFLSIISEILASLAGSPAPNVYETVVKQALPTLSNAISSASTDEAWVASSAIDLIGSLIQGAPESGIGSGFFATLAPSLFNCLLSAEDRDVLQNGVSCLTLVVRKDCAQILSWSDAGGNGLDNILKVIAKVLQNPDESGGLVIGDLIIHLLRRVGDSILPILPELLSAMVRRMLTAKTATFLQSLIIPFTFLINNNMLDQVLSLLEGINVDGRTGLDIFIQTWCENAETIQGFWPSRISTLALTQLYLSGRPSLQSLMVKGDIIVKPETKNIIMTRSKTKSMPQEFKSIPFPVKAIKLTLHDLQVGGESATLSSQNAVYEVDSDDGDEEWAEEEKQNQGFKADEFAFLSEMLGPRGVAFDNDEVLDDNDDEDLKNDPVSKMDMQGHIISFLKDCATQNVNNFNQYAGQLNEEETAVLHKVVAQ